MAGATDEPCLFILSVQSSPYLDPADSPPSRAAEADINCRMEPLRFLFDIELLSLDLIKANCRVQKTPEQSSSNVWRTDTVFPAYHGL